MSRLVSLEHAVLSWGNSGWQLRDLNSKNGTFVDQRRLVPGEQVRVTTGSEMAFGDLAEQFVMTDDAAPVAFARTSDGKRRDADSDGILFLPDPENPELVVYEDRPGHWLAEVPDGTSRAVKDQERLKIGSRYWLLTLPIVREKTLQPGKGPLLLSDLELRFTVSLDEEFVQIEIVDRGRVISLNPRSHGYLLLTLARARLQDRDGILPDSEHGWLGVPRVAAMLHTTEVQINVLIHRARQQFRQASVVGAKDVVQRRLRERKMRLGVGQIEIVQGKAMGNPLEE